MSWTDADRKRIWKYVQIASDDECWPWMGGRYPAGYGKTSLNGRSCIAHRIIYQLEFGPVPHDVHVCHSCDNPPCCNPAHLWPGSNLQNALDAKAKGRLAEGERVGTSKLTTEQVEEIIVLLKQGKTDREIARQMNVSPFPIAQIANGVWWKHVSGGRLRPERKRTKIDAEDVRIIRSMPFCVIRKEEVAELLGIKLRQLNRIITRERWANVA